MYRFTDSALIHEIQDAGDRLVVNARVARGGNVQEYRGSEMGVTDKAIVRVFRPADEVFDKDSVATFPHKFVTLGHPGIPAAFDKDAVGWIGDEVMRDGEFIRVPMTIAHRKAIDAVKSGTREMSVGYLTEIVFEDGVSPSGEAYDARMTKIVVDHVAIVDAARGGSQLRIGDWRAPGDKDRADKPPQLEMFDMTTKTILVDGLSVETTEAGAQAIVKLQKDIADRDTAAAKADAAHSAALAAKDAEIAKKDAEIDSLKGKVLTDAAIDARVQARADLIATAKSIHDADYTGKSEADIRKAAVVGKLGDAAVKDKPEAYIAARFDILAEDAAKTADPVRQTLIHGVDRQTVADNGYGQSVNDLDYRTRNLKKEA